MDMGIPAAVGNTAEIYISGQSIIKLFNPGRHMPEAQKEANKQSLAFSLGLPVPQVLEVREIFGRPAVIMQYVPGRPLGELMLEDQTRMREYMDASVNIQLLIHSADPTGFEPMAEKLASQIEAGPLEAARKRSLISQLGRMEISGLCHGDFHVLNLIRSEDRKIWVIDWNDATAGDIRADVCRSYLIYLAFSRELAAIYLRSYLEKSRFSKEEILFWMPVVAAARLSEQLGSGETQRLLRIVEDYSDGEIRP